LGQDVNSWGECTHYVSTDILNIDTSRHIHTNYWSSFYTPTCPLCSKLLWILCEYFTSKSEYFSLWS